MKNKKEKIVLFLMFVAGIFILFKEAIINGKMVFGHDAINIYIAFNEFARNVVHNYHCLPSWIPDIYFGMPMIASSSLLFFYPTDLIFILLNVPYHKVYTLDIIIHLFIAGWGMYLYLRSINLSRLTSYFGSSVIMMSGFILSYVYAGHINNVKAACLIPFAFYFIHRAFFGKKTKYILVAAFVLSLQMLATGMQIMAYTILGIFFYLVYFFVTEKNRDVRIKSVTGFFVLCIFILLFSAMQFLPSFNYTNYSWRGDFSFENFVSWSFPPPELITFLFPHFFGLYNETYWGFMPFVLTTYYFGITCFLLMPFFSFSGQHKSLSVFLIISSVVFAILSFGKYGILYDVFYYIPFFNQFRNPSRFLYLVTFFVVVLSCIGLESIIKKAVEEKEIMKRFKIIVCTAIVIMGIVFLFLVSGGLKDIIISGFNKIKGGNIDYKILDRILEGIRQDLIYFFVISGSVLTITYLFIKNKIKSAFIFILLLISINFLDNFRIEKNFLKFDYFENFVVQKHPIIDEIKKDKEPFRVMNLDQAFGPNRGIYYGIEMAGGLHGLAPRYFMEILQNGGLNKLNVNRFFNVKYYLTQNEVNIPDFIKVFTFGGIYLYKDTQAMQRMFATDKVIKVMNDNIALKMMLSDDFTGKEAIIHDFFVQNEMDKGEVTLKEYQPLKIEAEVSTQKGTFIVNSTSYYKNWKVKIDDKMNKLYRVNYNASGTYVPAGKHKVVFYYDEKDIYAGIIIAVLSCLFFILILVRDKFHFMIKKRQ